MKNVFYFSFLNTIGGTEQFFAYLSQKYKDWDITILYRNGDKRQIHRLRKYVRVERFVGQTIECDKAFFCFNSDIRPYVKAKQYALILHTDYKRMVEQGFISPTAKVFTDSFDKYYGVSKLVCDSWKQLTGKEAELVYNPFVIEPPKKLLKLVYCGRFTEEKGGDLLQKLVSRLNARGIDYRLFVYSNRDSVQADNVIFLGSRLDAGQFLNKSNYDYIVIPSKCEAYCYSLVQALVNGLPAVVTPCPVFKEIGVNSTNSITLDFDGANIDEVIDQMLNKEFKFKYTPVEDKWDKVMAVGKSDYVCRETLVEATQNYFDMELQEHVKKGDLLTVTTERGAHLVSRGVAKYT